MIHKTELSPPPFRNFSLDEACSELIANKHFLLRERFRSGGRTNGELPKIIDVSTISLRHSFLPAHIY